MKYITFYNLCIWVFQNIKLRVDADKSSKLAKTGVSHNQIHPLFEKLWFFNNDLFLLKIVELLTTLKSVGFISIHPTSFIDELQKDLICSCEIKITFGKKKKKNVGKNNNNNLFLNCSFEQCSDEIQVTMV